MDQVIKNKSEFITVFVDWAQIIGATSGDLQLPTPTNLDFNFRGIYYVEEMFLTVETSGSATPKIIGDGLVNIVFLDGALQTMPTQSTPAIDNTGGLVTPTLSATQSFKITPNYRYQINKYCGGFRVRSLRYTIPSALTANGNIRFQITIKLDSSGQVGGSLLN